MADAGVDGDFDPVSPSVTASWRSGCLDQEQAVVDGVAERKMRAKDLAMTHWIPSAWMTLRSLFSGGSAAESSCPATMMSPVSDLSGQFRAERGEGVRRHLLYGFQVPGIGREMMTLGIDVVTQHPDLCRYTFRS